MLYADKISIKYIMGLIYITYHTTNCCNLYFSNFILSIDKLKSFHKLANEISLSNLVTKYYSQLDSNNQMISTNIGL